METHPFLLFSQQIIQNSHPEINSNKTRSDYPISTLQFTLYPNWLLTLNQNPKPIPTHKSKIKLEPNSIHTFPSFVKWMIAKQVRRRREKGDLQQGNEYRASSSWRGQIRRNIKLIIKFKKAKQQKPKSESLNDCPHHSLPPFPRSEIFITFRKYEKYIKSKL